MRIQLSCILALLLIAPALPAQDAASPATLAAAPKITDTDWPSIPQDRLSVEKWATRHAAILEAEKTARPNLIFIGDSITQRWEAAGAHPETDYVSVFNHFYGDRNAMNLGFSGDTTANVLWRIQHGELDNIHPAVAVMLIGTNNNGASRTTPAPRTAAAIKLIVKQLHQKQPQMKILLIGILPKQTTTEKLAIDHAVNVTVAHDLAKDPLVTCVDVGSVFYNADGTLNLDLYQDQKIHPDHPALHPTAIGLRMQAQAIEPTLATLLGDKPKQWP
ncbi:MAG: GDSL-type esterase/lipase family protein [Acidobacteriaceae bacterium]|nr:GDSL-type esterase/lipase family protein [Acidobacteriaceae bacterium]